MTLKSQMKTLAILLYGGFFSMMLLLGGMLLYGDRAVSISAIYWTAVYFFVPSIFASLCYYGTPTQEHP